MSKTSRWLLTVLAALLVAAVLSAVWLHRQWQDRKPLSALEWTVAGSDLPPSEQVTVTWLGITSLLFDDGETQILIDGTFSRPSVADILLQRKIWSDVATINHALAEFRLDRLAAIVPVHSHFDHAMDVGYVANRTSAVILGSESTANIAEGTQVPVNQYQILADGEHRRFGKFTITLIASQHAPNGFGDNGWFPGIIEEPLRQPARVSEWRAGIAWSVSISHPEGTALIHGSGGFIEGTLPADSADVVMLGIGGLSGLGREYVGRYWAQTVGRSGASTVYPVHYDDYTRPFGEIMLFPAIVDDVVTTARWLDELAGDSDPPIQVRRLPFGQPVALYADRTDQPTRQGSSP